jgi:hypothetical protein
VKEAHMMVSTALIHTRCGVMSCVLFGYGVASLKYISSWPQPVVGMLSNIILRFFTVVVVVGGANSKTKVKEGIDM